MFDIGFWEVFFLFLLGLVVVGPQRLPTLARTVMLWVNKARRMVADVRNEVEKELQVEEIKQSIRQETPIDEMKQLADRVKAINTDLKADALDVSRSLKNSTAQPSISSTTPAVGSKPAAPTVPPPKAGAK